MYCTDFKKIWLFMWQIYTSVGKTKLRLINRVCERVKVKSLGGILYVYDGGLIFMK